MDEKKERRRQRSPAYPGIALGKAIELARVLSSKEGNHKVHVDTAIADMGYSTTSSPGMRALAALLAFGLLESAGSKDDRVVGLTKLAKTILFDNRQDSPERARALRDAALNPELHKNLAEKYPGRLPSDEELEHYLIVDQDFNVNAVDSVIRELRDTFTFAKLEEGDILPETVLGGDVPNEDSTSFAPLKTKAVKSMNQPQAELHGLTVPLVGRGMAVLRVPIPLSKENYDYIVQWLKLMEKPLTNGGNAEANEKDDAAGESA